MSLAYYLALLQLHVAVVGVILAGVAALVQLLHGAKPRRDIRLLAGWWTLTLYGGLLAGVLILLALGSYVAAFPEYAATAFGQGIVDFFQQGVVGLAAMLLMLLSLVWFIELALKARTLLESQQYLRSYARRLPTDNVHVYLKKIYADDDNQLDFDEVDPFQPIREYIKDNAFTYDDFDTGNGLRHFSDLFDRALKSSRERSDQPEYVRLARYISESCEEFFRIFMKTASEKRKIDTIELLYSKGVLFLKGEHDVAHASLLPFVRGLETIAKISEDDDEVITCLRCIRQLCDIFLEGHPDSTWDHIAGVFDEICLAVTRITEDYYLSKNNSLKTVPIVGYSTGEHQTVTTALVDFFKTYRNLGERYADATPLYYFEAIEGVIEVLFVRLGDIVESGQQKIGFNMKYHELAHDLYNIYYEYGQDAIEHDKPEQLGLALINLRRILKPAENFKLDNAREELCVMVVELAAEAISKFGDIAIRPGDERTIADYAAETLVKHAAKAHITTAITTAKKSDRIKQTAAVQKFLRHLKPA
jgi:hypothetical protein